jgi:signal transduction histidine kinase
MQQLIGELVRDAANYQLPIATNISQARSRLWRLTPLAILLDESAVRGSDDMLPHGPGSLEACPDPLEAAVRELAEVAPVVLVAAPERQKEFEHLTPLVRRGKLDVVARTGNFVPLAASLLERHVTRAESQNLPELPPEEEVSLSHIVEMPERLGAPDAFFDSPDFGEILRHEVNNPLTGILGNAELLLSRRDHLPSAAVQRLETIAALAVRLRETVRRLSNAWEESHHRTRLA